MIGLNGGSVDVFLHMVSIVLVPWGVRAILGNRCEIQGQNYVALLQGSEITTGFHYRSWILDIQGFRLVAMNVHWWPNG